MAQHISIINSELKKYQNIVKTVENQFSKGLKMMKYAFRYERMDSDYAFNENEIVFCYKKKINSFTEVFEIHYDKEKNKISNIFLVK